MLSCCSATLMGASCSHLLFIDSWRFTILACSCRMLSCVAISMTITGMGTSILISCATMCVVVCPTFIITSIIVLCSTVIVSILSYTCSISVSVVVSVSTMVVVSIVVSVSMVVIVPTMIVTTIVISATIVVIGAIIIIWITID